MKFFQPPREVSRSLSQASSKKKTKKPVSPFRLSFKNQKPSKNGGSLPRRTHAPGRGRPGGLRDPRGREEEAVVSGEKARSANDEDDDALFFGCGCCCCSDDARMSSPVSFETTPMQPFVFSSFRIFSSFLRRETRDGTSPDSQPCGVGEQKEGPRSRGGVPFDRDRNEGGAPFFFEGEKKKRFNRFSRSSSISSLFSLLSTSATTSTTTTTTGPGSSSSPRRTSPRCPSWRRWARA